jgi:hypothetical protein
MSSPFILSAGHRLFWHEAALAALPALARAQPTCGCAWGRSFNTDVQ